MYTIKDYLQALSEEQVKFSNFIGTLDQIYVDFILKAIETGEILELSNYIETTEHRECFEQVKKKMTQAELLVPTDFNLDIYPASLMAKVIMTYHLYLKSPTADRALVVIKSYNQLNPHRTELRKILDKLNDGELDDYIYDLKTDKFRFINYDNTIVKIVSNILIDYTLVGIDNELLCTMALNGESNEDICACSGFYINEDFNETDEYVGILLYKGKNVLDTNKEDTTFCNLNDLEELQRNWKQYLSEEAHPVLTVDLSFGALEPIYIQESNVDDGSDEINALTINYPFLKPLME